ncbi:hypothetical protein J8F10_21750 [Gemmata sp. G18]|uniref:Uncharacterized protein n=1 Tax=Gemmata palustris TaxID=2822762 RepID=A0ABS5BVY2_9BACT|nr:hypothetical protein [Gemmata palustris]MBP3957887.1 hypothetical protein [Gemmata palustris]
MTLTLLTLTGISFGLTAVYVLTAKSKEAVLAGENTVVGLSDPAADTLATGRHSESITRTDWQLTTVGALSEAEELLDVLECQGYSERELVVLGNSCFAVRWR